MSSLHPVRASPARRAPWVAPRRIVNHTSVGLRYCWAEWRSRGADEAAWPPEHPKADSGAALRLRAKKGVLRSGDLSVSAPRRSA